MGDSQLAAAVLVGGRSRRMGENKALIRLDPQGPTLIETVVDTLRAITDDIMLVGSVTAEYALLNLSLVADLMPNAGALGGIQAALSATTRSHVLVVACDMPFLSVDLLRFMAAQPRDYDVLISVSDQQQPLHAIYAQSALPLIAASLSAGNHRVTGWLAQANVRILDLATLKRHDPSLRSWFNMNTPEDAARARQLLAEDATSSEDIALR